jgi:hypothetical protein
VATVQAATPLIPYDSSFQNENEKANLLLKRILVWDKLIDAVYPWVKRTPQLPPLKIETERPSDLWACVRCVPAEMQKVEATSAKSYAKLTPLIQFQDEAAAGAGTPSSFLSLFAQPRSVDARIRERRLGLTSTLMMTTVA